MNNDRRSKHSEKEVKAMPQFSPTEQHMWDDPERTRSPLMPDHEIENKYEQGEQRIVTELNREKLPNFVHALSKPGYITLRPFYQRRARWDERRQSRLIESFIMNIPVPPVFLYEKALNQYEVMDGQQRITALQAFYDNTLRLKGLESWPELNGRSYKTLPAKIRAGLDRRSISSIVLLKESAPTEEAAMLLKRIVFERLNTGGVKLGRQEIRNSLFQGLLNTKLLSWSDFSLFRRAWDIPDVPSSLDGPPPPELSDNTMYTKMEDVELILRFLALRHVDHFQGGMQGFLDRYMIRSRTFGDADLGILDSIFKDTITLCVAVYEAVVFRAFDPNANEWETRPHKSFADAVTVGMSRKLDRRGTLIAKKDRVIELTKGLFRDSPPGTFTGAANTKEDVQNRIRLYETMLDTVLQE
jgi:uncharacterized protein DUF262